MIRTPCTALLLIGLLCAPVVRADEPTPAWPTHRHAADVLSTSAVATAIGLDTLASWKSGDRKHAFLKEGERIAVTVAISEVLKHLFPRARPDGSDRMSFPSEHTALAVASGGWNLRISIPLSAGTGYLRLAANKHHPSDVLAGAALGAVLAAVVK